MKSGIERRKFGRRVVSKPAAIVYVGGERVRCLVIDISEGGARLQAADVNSLQTRFDLEIPEDDLVVSCEIVHYLPHAVGVRYVASPKRLSWRSRREPAAGVN